MSWPAVQMNPIVMKMDTVGPFPGDGMNLASLVLELGSTDTRFVKLFPNGQWSSLQPYDDAAPFIIAYNNSKAAPSKLLSLFPLGCMLIAASPTCFVSPMDFERVRFFVFSQIEVAAEYAIGPTIPGNLLDSSLSC